MIEFGRMGGDPPSNSPMEGIGGGLHRGHSIQDDDSGGDDALSNSPTEDGEEREICDDDSGSDGHPSNFAVQGWGGRLIHMGHSIEDDDSGDDDDCDDDDCDDDCGGDDPLSNSPMEGREERVRSRRGLFSERDDDEEVQWPKKQRRTTEEQNQGNNQLVDEQEEEEAIGDRSVCATLTEPEVLDCPICFEHLVLPVFQCHNGHLACSSCCSKLGNKCPSCSSLVGFHRNLGVEKILESVKIPCQNMKYGCKEMVFLSKRHDHQHKCMCAPCSCPLPDCDFVGSSKNLSLHFSDKHHNSAQRFRYNNLIPISLDKQQKYFILQEEEEAEGSLFILNNGVETYGNVINVSCIGQSSINTKFSYNLLAMNRDSSVTLESLIEFAPAWVEHTPLERFLVIPKDFVGSCGKLKLELRIWS